MKRDMTTFYSIETAAEHYGVDPEELLICVAKGDLDIYSSMPETVEGGPANIRWSKKKSVKFAQDTLMADDTGLNYELRELSTGELEDLERERQDVWFTQEQLDGL